MFLSTNAWALLGGFEVQDGYRFLGSLPNDWIDVTNYNAGANNVNAGNGPLTPIPYNTGLWKVLGTGPGSFYINNTDRATYMGSAPPYPATGFKGPQVGSYLIGDHGGGHTGNALAMRNTAPAGSGAMLYDYRLDQYDFGGTAPATVVSGSIDTSFWYWPSDPQQTVVPPQEKFIMSFTDSTGSVGFQWGYARDNQLYWRPGSSGSWNLTGLFSDPVAYDQLKVNIDLTAQTFKIDVFDFSTSLTTTIAPTQALGATMIDYTHIGWSLTDNLQAGPLGWGGKNFFDDFGFKVNPVPEPSAAMVLVAAGAALLLKRPRRRG
jgi:hypothetical protein